jgi:hypothetical protein
MIRKPGAPDLYGFYEQPNRMPPFGPEQLNSNDVDMVVRYLKNDYLPPSRPTPEMSTAGNQIPKTASPTMFHLAAKSPGQAHSPGGFDDQPTRLPESRHGRKK